MRRQHGLHRGLRRPDRKRHRSQGKEYRRPGSGRGGARRRLRTVAATGRGRDAGQSHGGKSARRGQDARLRFRAARLRRIRHPGQRDSRILPIFADNRLRRVSPKRKTRRPASRLQAFPSSGRLEPAEIPVDRRPRMADRPGDPRLPPFYRAEAPPPPRNAGPDVGLGLSGGRKAQHRPGRVHGRRKDRDRPDPGPSIGMGLRRHGRGNRKAVGSVDSENIRDVRGAGLPGNGKVPDRAAGSVRKEKNLFARRGGPFWTEIRVRSWPAIVG